MTVRVVVFAIAKCYDCGWSKLFHPAEAERFKEWHESRCPKVIIYADDGKRIRRRRMVTK